MMILGFAMIIMANPKIIINQRLSYFHLMENVSVIILLLFGITFLGVLSNKYKFPLPIILVLSGLAISLVPGLPVIELNPEVVFLVFFRHYYMARHGTRAGMISKHPFVR
jgi:ABC-type uncharacterized transport system permease subunit